MSLPTNRQDGDIIDNQDINAMAAAINDHEDRLTSVESGDGTSGPGHASVALAAETTLPVDKAVLSVQATTPAEISLPAAPDGRVITVHVVNGWELITWAADIVVAGDTTASETWVVLVRTGGVWHALVSSASAPTGGGGGATGTGFPEGVVAAPPGTVYFDTAVTNGARQWVKRTGEGTTGWEVIHGDTGLRRINGDEVTGTEIMAGAGRRHFRRVGSTVYLDAELYLNEALPVGGEVKIYPSALVGFRPHAMVMPGVFFVSGGGLQPVGAQMYSDGSVYITTPPGPALGAQWDMLTLSAIYLAKDGWPATLPGIAV